MRTVTAAVPRRHLRPRRAGSGYRQVQDVSAHANPSPGATLYNQQAAAGKSDLAFANPALYAAKGTDFHGITSGGNGAARSHRLGLHHRLGLVQRGDTAEQGARPTSDT
ncbi:hypothetical protein OG223_17650 [Streptomyces sp. NBC_01478]|uniref:hypothetical protein n=1 Tax=Streptomyces sp. NBC_01478 TaxID=2903882 RepID=UPI002E2EA519|nr:hypothetical protein [Streptomyces sp. NBC_01478]